MIQSSSRGDEGAHVAAAAAQVEHHVGDALAGPVIGELAAAPAAVDGQALRIEQVLGPRAGAGGVERRVLEQPDELGRAPVRDRRRAGLHDADGRVVVDGPIADGPLDGGEIAEVHARAAVECWSVRQGV